MDVVFGYERSFISNRKDEKTEWMHIMPDHNAVLWGLES